MPELVKVGGEFLVNTETASNQYDPTLTGLANGGFVVTWADTSGTLGDSSDFAVKAQVFGADGAKIGSEFLVNTQTASFQYLQTITGLANGGFVISWMDYSGTLGDSDASIKAQIFDAGGAKIGSEFRVNTVTTMMQSGPSITDLAGGGFVVTWSDDSGFLSHGPTLLKGQVFDAAGAKVGGEFLVCTDPANYQFSAKISGLANGRFVATWSDTSGTGGDSTGSGISAQVFEADGTPVGSAFLVNTVTANDQVYSTITGLADGGFVITWSDSNPVPGDSVGYNLKAQVFDAGGAKIGGEFLVNTELANAQFDVEITGLASGGFVATWYDLSGTLGDSDASSIKAQVFAADGTKVGGEFLVNTYTRMSQDRPAVTGLANGDFAITWRDLTGTLGDAAGYSIKAQIFGMRSAPAITSNGGGATAQVSVDENGRTVTEVHATDADAGDKIVYAITGGSDAALFKINAATGVLSFKASPDFEAPADTGSNNVYSVTVRASDGTFASSQDIAITVHDVVHETLLGTRLNDTLITVGGNDIIKGGRGDDTLASGLGNDRLSGGPGADRMEGGAGNDIYYVDNANDTTIEAADKGIDQVRSVVTIEALADNLEGLSLLGTANLDGAGNGLRNWIKGNTGNNVLRGLGENDLLSGGAGDDTLSGGAGKDWLTGGIGADRFVFDTAPGAANADKIKDFTSADNDKIQISKSVFTAFANAGGLTDDAFYAAAGAKSAHDDTDRVIYDTATGRLYYDDDGLGGHAAVLFATVGAGSHPLLIFSDIAIIA